LESLTGILELDSKIEQAMQVVIAVSTVFGIRVVFGKRICGSRPPLTTRTKAFLQAKI
jgi:hypothetical protein